MANQSEKKTKLKNIGRTKYLIYTVVGISLWYLLMEIITGSLTTISNIVLLVGLTGVNYLCTKLIIKCWDLDLPQESYEYYLDVIVVNLLAQFLSTITSYGWYVYLLVPGYLLILFGKWFWRWITPEYVEEDPEEEKGGDKKKKKEEKDKKPKVKYIK